MEEQGGPSGTRVRRPSFLVSAQLGGARGGVRPDSWVVNTANPLASMGVRRPTEEGASAAASLAPGGGGAVDVFASPEERRELMELAARSFENAPACESDPELSDEDACPWEMAEEEKLDQPLHIEKEGWLVKEGRFIRSWKKRWFVLQGDSLQYFTATNRKLKGTIKLESCVVKPADRKDKKECLELITEGRKLYFLANDFLDQQEWVIAINNKIASLSYERKARESQQIPDFRVQTFFKNPTATSLSLDESPALVLEALTALADPFKYHAHLRVLSLKNCQIGAPELASLQLGLGENTSLLDLDLSCNLLEGELCGRGLADLLRSNRSILRLNVEQNSLGDAGLHSLAPVLQLHPLECLNLSLNGIGDEGARALGAILEECPNMPLTALQLSNNNISDSGFPSLARGIHHNPNILDVQLKYNALENVAAESLAEVLVDEACRIHSLDLSFNKITLVGIETLAKALHCNRTVTMLDLGGNRLSDQALVALMNADPRAYFQELELTRSDKRAAKVEM